MSIGSRIKQRREELGYTQPQLAKLVGVSKGTIGNYESNISSPNETILFKLFEILKCDANFLYQDNIELDKFETFTPYETQHIKKYRTLDEYGKKAVDDLLDTEYERCTYVEEEDTITLPFSLLKASAGLGDYLFDENFEEIEVEGTTLANQADFVIEVDGDSMLPKFENGDKVFVKGQQNIDFGDIGIFIIDGCGYIKQVGEGELISLNPDYPNVELHDYNDIKCIGKVIGKVE